MPLSDRDIKKAVAAGDIIIDPFDEKLVQPASIDVRLGRYLAVPNREKAHLFDITKPMDALFDEWDLVDQGDFMLKPGAFVLAMTYERIGAPNGFVPFLHGKSSPGRLAVFVHVTAGLIDPGNVLKITMELKNAGDWTIPLRYKKRFGQVTFDPLSSPCEKTYEAKGDAKYFGDDKPKPSKFYLHFNETDD